MDGRASEVGPRLSEGTWPDADSDQGALAEVIRVAEASPLITLATATAHGWPMVSCMHFGVSEEQGRPIIYMLTHDGTRKLANITAESRVCLGLFEADAKGERLALRLDGRGAIIQSPDEQLKAIDVQMRRPGYEFMRYLTPQFQPGIRVEVTRATHFGVDGSRRDILFPLSPGQDRLDV